ncbi:MAG: sigma-54-dependent Fis family transcriptional regulator [Deltaproteobacteria bacterium]|nr:sigma-54-dependent Fis family transcriptional regulator [Deltaproteobacteria bacterium]
MHSNSSLGFPKERRKIDHLWDRFIVKRDLNSAEAEDPQQRLIISEWERCRSLGVDPRLRFGVTVSAANYEKTLQDQGWILRVIRPILQKTADLLQVRGVFLFTEPSGTVIFAAGDAHTRVKLADSINVVEGSTWAESNAGNNGMGTAVVKRSPVYVFSSEHYCQGWHDFACAASPVLDPFSGAVVGVVDMSTLEKDYREDAVALVYTLSSLMSTELRLKLEVERLQLISQYTDFSTRYPNDDVLIVDRLGHVVRSSRQTDNEAGDAGPATASTSDAPVHTHQVCGSDQQEEIGTLYVMNRRGPSRKPVPGSRLPGLAAYGEFVTASNQMKTILEAVERVIPTNVNVLLVGETGTGKELIASYVHNQSERRSGPYIAVNCGAISRELFESKFFGYERGAFTGADPRGRKGVFESAQGGTLFLDEIGELPLEIQASLLRVLDTGRFRRVGSETELTTDCRLIAATNRSLLKEIRLGTFRSDLYYRLGVAVFSIPPLRERPLDIRALIELMAASFSRKYSLPPKTFTPEAVKTLLEYPWPGNARELRNLVESMVICARDPVRVEDLPAPVLDWTRGQGFPAGVAQNTSREPAGQASYSMRENERKLIIAALRNSKSISEVAKSLGISRSTLYRKFVDLGIVPEEYVGLY